MLATVPPGDTNCFQVMSWVAVQGLYLDNPTQHALLYYLCTKAFYSTNNPEKAPVGQVMYQASRFDEICLGTSIRSRDTVRLGLNGLQEQAYITRSKRSGGNHHPHLITVAWTQNMDEYREQLRAGEADLLPVFATRPSRARKPHLAVVRDFESENRIPV